MTRIQISIEGVWYEVRRLPRKQHREPTFALIGAEGEDQVVEFRDAGAICSCGECSAFGECVHADSVREAYAELAIPIRPDKRFFSLTPDSHFDELERKAAAAGRKPHFRTIDLKVAS
jgi:hypothetical protein